MSDNDRSKFTSLRYSTSDVLPNNSAALPTDEPCGPATRGSVTHGSATHGSATHGSATHGSTTHGTVWQIHSPSSRRSMSQVWLIGCSISPAQTSPKQRILRHAWS